MTSLADTEAFHQAILQKQWANATDKLAQNIEEAIAGSLRDLAAAHQDLKDDE